MRLPFKFELQGYCEYCPEFEPELESEDVTAVTDEMQKVVHTIRCMHRSKCQRAVRTMNQVIR